MNWRIAAPLVTTVAILATAWGGIATEEQNPALSAGLWLLSGLLLGVLFTQIVVMWWIDVHRDEEER